MSEGGTLFLDLFAVPGQDTNEWAEHAPDPPVNSNF
jgi:hypothetical protein